MICFSIEVILAKLMKCVILFLTFCRKVNLLIFQIDNSETEWIRKQIDKGHEKFSWPTWNAYLNRLALVKLKLIAFLGKKKLLSYEFRKSLTLLKDLLLNFRPLEAVKKLSFCKSWKQFSIRTDVSCERYSKSGAMNESVKIQLVFCSNSKGFSNERNLNLVIYDPFPPEEIVSLLLN